MSPSWKLQRELLDIPRGRERFDAYLRAVLNDARDEAELAPLVAMNPMAREHVARLLDDLLAINADGVAASAIADAAYRVRETSGAYRIALVVADDARGGWTNRGAVEYGHAFESGGTLKRGWLSGLLWSSEPASAQAAREAVLTPIYRADYRARYGAPRTLRDRLAQEGYALAMAGCMLPTLGPDDLAYTRDVVVPLLDAEDMRTAVECLYGDPAARSLGFTPRGLTARAGLALALADAKARPAT